MLAEFNMSIKRYDAAKFCDITQNGRHIGHCVGIAAKSGLKILHVIALAHRQPKLSIRVVLKSLIRVVSPFSLRWLAYANLFE